MPAMKHRPTDGAMRAAEQIERNLSFVQSTAEIIDCETGVRELVEMLENIIAEAGDLIESRSPELVAEARAAFRHFRRRSSKVNAALGLDARASGMVRAGLDFDGRGLRQRILEESHDSL